MPGMRTKNFCLSLPAQFPLSFTGYSLTLPTDKSGGFLVRRPLRRILGLGVLHDLPKREFPCAVSFRVPHGTFAMLGCLGFVLQGSPQDILCRVMVAVVMRSALRARPFADAEVLHLGVLIAADAARLARRIEGLDL